MQKLSDKLHYYFFEEERPDEVSIASIFALTEERLFGFPLALIAFFGMFPIPGVSAIFGFSMLVITLQLCTGQSRPWVPQRILQTKFSLAKLQDLMRNLLPWLRRIEKVAKPRLTPICKSFIGKTILGIILSAMAFLVLLPIPGANTVPSLGIFIAALGLQEDDGILSLVGMGISLAFGCLLLGIVWTGSSVFDLLKHWLIAHIALLG